VLCVYLYLEKTIRKRRHTIRRKEEVKQSRARRQKRSQAASGPNGTVFRHPAALPKHSTAHTLNQESILRMQRRYGNAAVQRYLASNGLAGKPAAVQRAPKKETKKDQKSGGKPKDPIHNKIYELVKEHLGEAKLKKHAKSIGEAAAKALIEQMKDADSEDDFLKKAQTKLIGKVLKDDIQKSVTELLNSPEGKELRGKILHAFKTEPNVAVAGVLVGLAAAIAANAPAKLDLDGKIGKSGLKWAAKADLGKLRAFSLNQIKAGLAYSGKEYGANVSFDYTGEQDKGGDKTEPAKATTSATLDFKQGSMKTDLGPIVTRPQISLTTKLILSNNPVGVAAIKIGDKKDFLSTQMQIDANGKVVWQFGQMSTIGAVGLQSTFKTGGDATGAHKLTLDKPFGVPNLDLSASITYTLTDPVIKEAGLNLQYKLIDKKDSPIPLMYLQFNGQFSAAKGQEPQQFVGLAVIQGRF
jgi:hypothetical protein